VTEQDACHNKVGRNSAIITGDGQEMMLVLDKIDSGPPTAVSQSPR